MRLAEQRAISRPQLNADDEAEGTEDQPSTDCFRNTQ